MSGAEDKRVEARDRGAEGEVAALAIGAERGGWDAWRALVACSPARIGLGRAGAGVRTAVHLELLAAHAAARDAVHLAWDVEATRAALELPSCVVRSSVADRQDYLLRPDRGRQLFAEDLAKLWALAPGRGHEPWDVALVLSNGLSTEAVVKHGPGLVTAIVEVLGGLRVAPIVLVRDGRVALGDPIARALRAKLVVVVIGERPGLSAADSLGIYLTLMREGALSDADRNCISNVHPPGGLGYREAAEQTGWLVREALARGVSGVALKDESGREPTPTLTPTLTEEA